MDSASANIKIGGTCRFELSSITIKTAGDLLKNKDLLKIDIGGDVLYEQDTDEMIRIGEPLLLTGPSKAISAVDPIYMCFGDYMRYWGFDPCDIIPEYGEKIEIKLGLQTKVLKDPQSGAEAEICYQLFTKALDAHIEFKYTGPSNRSIQILEGEIYATEEGDKSETKKRVLLSIGSAQTSSGKRKRRDETYISDSPIKLDRSLLAIPVGSRLAVTVKLKYHLIPLSGQAEGRGTIWKTLSIPLGTHCNEVHERVFESDDFEWDSPESDLGSPLVALNMKVTWSDDIEVALMLFDPKKLGEDFAESYAKFHTEYLNSDSEEGEEEEDDPLK